MKGMCNVQWTPLKDVPHASQLIEQLIELHLNLGHPSAEGLEDSEELCAADPNSSEKYRREHVEVGDVGTHCTCLVPRHVESRE